MLGDGLGNARAVVGDVDREAVGLASGRDLDPAPASLQARARDCLGRVVDDIHEDLLDLIRVHLDFRQPRLEAERQLDARREQLVLEELVRRLEDRPDRLQLALAFLAARERQQVAHNGRGAFRLLSDHGERLGEARRDVRGLPEQVTEADD